MQHTSAVFPYNKSGGPSLYKGGLCMANYTQHYQLHQWVPEDDFLRTDFNTDFQKIDTALNTVEETLRSELNGGVTRLEGSLETLRQEVNATHSGDVQRLESSLNTLRQEVTTTHTGDVQRLDAALITAQQTLRNELSANIQQVNTALGSIQALANSKEKILFGSYSGNGAKNRTIDLGVTIKWVLLVLQNGTMSSFSSGLAAPNYPVIIGGSSNYLQVSGTSILVYADSSNGSSTNVQGYVYYYLVGC